MHDTSLFRVHVFAKFSSRYLALSIAPRGLSPGYTSGRSSRLAHHGQGDGLLQIDVFYRPAVVPPHVMMQAFSSSTTRGNRRNNSGFLKTDAVIASVFLRPIPIGVHWREYGYSLGLMLSQTLSKRAKGLCPLAVRLLVHKTA